MVPYSEVPARPPPPAGRRGAGGQLAGAKGEAQVRAGDFPSWLSHQISGHDKLTCRRRSCPSPSLLPSLSPAPPGASRGGAGRAGRWVVGVEWIGMEGVVVGGQEMDKLGADLGTMWKSLVSIDGGVMSEGKINVTVVRERRQGDGVGNGPVLVVLADKGTSFSNFQDERVSRKHKYYRDQEACNKLTKSRAL